MLQVLILSEKSFKFFFLVLHVFSSILPRTDLHIRSALPSEAKLSGVACHEGRILLVDRYKSRLYIFENECDDRFGQVKLKISGTNSTSAPWDVCGSLSGRCIVTFPECNVLADVDIIARKVVHCIHVLPSGVI
jgi:hypothetical protein